MRTLALVLCLLAVPAFAADAPDAKTAVKLTEYMLKTPLNEADSAVVSGFMKIDTETLPKKMRERARAKQLEIDAFVKIKEGKKKGPFRFPAACTVKPYEGEAGMRTMSLMGSERITEEEEQYLELKGNCTEEQLLCEFSLNIVIIRRKDKPPLKHYFLMPQDPLMAWVAEKRGGGGSAGNRYFQETKPSCQALAR